MDAATNIIDLPAKSAGSKTALVLSGGGARAAYQVGVLKAVSEILPRQAGNPFPIVCGTSAGALNAVAIATFASRFRLGVHGLETVWRNFRSKQVYRTEFLGLVGRGSRWLSALFLSGLGAKRPVSLLDNAPLAQLLERMLRFDRIQQAIERGDLHAVSVTCSGYSSGESVSFFEAAREVGGWRRNRRLGVRSRIGLRHLLASSAIPALFPAVQLNREYFGDGSVRQLAPLSPALHLGADRILVVGVSGSEEMLARGRVRGAYPSVAQVAGHLLNAAFLDGLEVDLERLERNNRIAAMLAPEQRAQAEAAPRHIEVLKILPSEPLDQIAARYAYELPASMRFFLRGTGADGSAGATVLSYLLFERGYCRALIDLGYRDAMRLRSELSQFLSQAEPAAAKLADPQLR